PRLSLRVLLSGLSQQSRRRQAGRLQGDPLQFAAAAQHRLRLDAHRLETAQPRRARGGTGRRVRLGVLHRADRRTIRRSPVLDQIARLISALALAVFAIVLIVWIYPDKPSKFLRTDLMTVQEGDTFFTGFANLAVVRFSSNGQMRSLKAMRSGNLLEDAD